ncbi:YgjV family protein [Arthrobacter sp. BB-1]|uniref:CBU_0592 family membrane protein n=1 Tax=unclassified Arthrobacter TaxID=235627 RepID=UPI0010E755B8|nr:MULTISPECIES: YgjV family protein [unclassified Arthrobacter]TNB67246.1 YgjV family protein [Arthrobacter sp. BB-1]VII98737.1 hypothetical protein [Arthrobacter sp. DR-2P]
MELLWEITGWAGATAILSAYLAISMNWIQAGRAFQTANLLGACAFIVNSAFHGAWPSVATNIVWFLISGVALLRLHMPKSPATPSSQVLDVQPAGSADTAGQLGVGDVLKGAPVNGDTVHRDPITVR